MPRISVFVLSATLAISGCAQETVDGAASGAASGAVGGALSASFAALVFGGNPVEAAAQGAAVGATLGGVAGAASGSQRGAQSRASDEAFRRSVGPTAYSGLEELVACRHQSALQSASSAQGSSNANFALAGLWLEAVTLSDMRNEAAARALYPRIVATDAKISNDREAEAALRDLRGDLAQTRRDAGRNPVCA